MAGIISFSDGNALLSSGTSGFFVVVNGVSTPINATADFSKVVYSTGAQIISGQKTFQNTAIFNGGANVFNGLNVSGGSPTFNADVFFNQFATFTNNPFIGSARPVLTTGNQTITGSKIFNGTVSFNGLSNFGGVAQFSSGVEFGAPVDFNDSIEFNGGSINFYVAPNFTNGLMVGTAKPLLTTGANFIDSYNAFTYSVDFFGGLGAAGMSYFNAISIDTTGNRFGSNLYNKEELATVSQLNSSLFRTWDVNTPNFVVWSGGAVTNGSSNQFAQGTINLDSSSGQNGLALVKWGGTSAESVSLLAYPGDNARQINFDRHHRFSMMFSLSSGGLISNQGVGRFWVGANADISGTTTPSATGEFASKGYGFKLTPVGLIPYIHNGTTLYSGLYTLPLSKGTLHEAVIDYYSGELNIEVNGSGNSLTSPSGPFNYSSGNQNSVIASAYTPNSSSQFKWTISSIKSLIY